jgi:hypothetical protein
MISRLLNQPFLCRKDIALLLDYSETDQGGYRNSCTVESVRANERSYGLDVARVDINARVVRYHTSLVVQQLALRGKLPLDVFTCVYFPDDKAAKWKRKMQRALALPGTFGPLREPHPVKIPRHPSAVKALPPPAQ